MGNYTQTVKGLNPQAITFISYGMLLISIIISCIFYASLGQSIPQKAIFGFMGFFMAILGAIGAGSMGYFSAQRNYLIAFFALLLWLAQFLAAIFAHNGFGALAIADRNKSTDLAKAIQKNATNSKATHLDNGLLDDINAQLNQAKKELAGCPPNFFKACINPKKIEVANLETQQAKIKASVESAKANQASINNLAQIESGKGLGELNSHPLFLNYSALLDDVKPSEMQAGFLLFVAVLFELSVSFIFYLKYSISGEIEYQEKPALSSSNEIPNKEVSNQYQKPVLTNWSFQEKKY
jgi:hypothetical protein